MKMKKRFFSILLSLVMVLGLIPGMSLKALADTTDIGVGTTWYIGDSFNLAGKYVNPSGTGYATDNYVVCGDNTHTVLPPYFRNDLYTHRNYWIFEDILSREDGVFNPALQIDCPDGKTSSDIPTGIRIKSGGGTSQTDRYVFEVVYDVPSTGNVAIVELDKSTASVETEKSVALTASITPAFASDKTVVWSVNNNNVKLYSDAACTTPVDTGATSTLTVYAQGVSQGDATVTVASNANSGKTASCNVSVSNSTDPGSANNPWQVGSPNAADVKAWLTGSGDSKTLHVSGSGAMADYNDLSQYDNSYPWGQYSEKIVRVSIEDGVTSIASYAFSYCSNLTTADIPASVTSIKEDAFSYCALTAIHFPDGITEINNAFSHNPIKKVVVPDSVTAIGANAFFDCSELSNVELPYGLRSMQKTKNQKFGRFVENRQSSEKTKNG